MRFLCESSQIHNKKDSPTPNNVKSMADRPSSYSFDAEVSAFSLLNRYRFLPDLKKKIMKKTENKPKPNRKKPKPKKTEKIEPNRTEPKFRFGFGFGKKPNRFKPNPALV